MNKLWITPFFTIKVKDGFPIDSGTPENCHFSYFLWCLSREKTESNCCWSYLSILFCDGTHIEGLGVGVTGTFEHIILSID